MHSVLRFLTIASLALLLSLPARAASMGIGVLTMPKAALSIQLNPDEAPCAYHVAAHFAASEVIADLDCQRMMRLTSLSGRAQATAAYAGFGLRGEADRARGGEESYHLRLPLGLQVDMRRLHLSGFAETSALLGPLPTTTVSMGAAIGVRTFF